MFSINEALNQTEKEEESDHKIVEEDLPDGHFSNIDVENEWKVFLKRLSKENIVAYHAIQNFTLHKTDEHEITLEYVSESARVEFDKVKDDFLSHFKHKYKNYRIQLIYQKNEQQIIINTGNTKREIFKQMMEVNPLLKDLNDMMNFDFN